VNLSKLNFIFVAVIVVAAGAFAAGFMFPGLRELSRERDKISVEIDKARQMQSQLGDMSKLYEGLMTLRENEQSLWYLIPMEPRLGQLQGRLATLAEESGIEAPEIQPNTPLDVEPSRLPEQLRLAANLTVQPIMVKFEGQFDQLTGFLAAIEKMERLVRVDSLKIVNNEQKPGRIVVEMLLHAYHRRMAS